MNDKKGETKTIKQKSKNLSISNDISREIICNSHKKDSNIDFDFLKKEPKTYHKLPQ